MGSSPGACAAQIGAGVPVSELSKILCAAILFVVLEALHVDACTRVDPQCVSAWESVLTHGMIANDRDELREAMKNKYGRKPSEPLLDTLISTLDVNKDGEISPWEYRKFIEKRKAAVCYAGSGGAVGAPADAQRLDTHKF